MAGHGGEHLRGLGARIPAYFRPARGQVGQRLGEELGHREPREPLTICRHRIPRGILRGGALKHRLVGIHIGGPLGARRHIRRRILPVFIAARQPAQQPEPLFLITDKQSHLDERISRIHEFPLELINLFVPLLDLRGSGQLINLPDQHVLVMRAVKNADHPGRR